ncbi:MAG: hypothetical protein RBT61_12765, partial [Candidatus Kapabacteria bacterium]|nr:hypothetical protein [Candidatus Kapabacteria bacterium]
GGNNVRFNYSDDEVQGIEELYLLTLFYRKYDGANGTFYINSGAGYGIEPVNNRFYVDEVNRKDTLEDPVRLLLDGEWTCGQEEAISTFYYSRIDGDWTDPNTWSKQGYNGPPAASIPSTINDKAFVGNGRTVELDQVAPQIKAVSVANTGRLSMKTVNAKIQADSVFIQSGGTLAVSNEYGVNTIGETNGHIQINLDGVLSYSTEGIYEFIGGIEQPTGTGLPDIVGALIVNKSNSDDILNLSKSVLIKDSLVIKEGIFKLGNFTANGETGDTTGRSIKMYGGELEIHTFPTKYKNAVFNAGTVTFTGTGSFRIPSSQSPMSSEPAVTQYHNINLKGARGANTYVTLDPQGEIRVNGLLDISGLSFNPNPITDRFIVSGSTLVFNGDSTQHIQTGYSTPTGLNYRLKFHTLVIDGEGDKLIMPPNDANPDENYVLVRSLLDLKQGTLITNNHTIKVLGHWNTDIGAEFEPGNGLVIFEADGKETTVKSSGISFNDVRIMGTAINGYVSYTDSMDVAGDLTINPNFFRSLNNAPLSVRGNFINNGKFVANTGRVYFNGDGDRELIHNGIGNFYNLTVNKSSGMLQIDGDSLIKITNNLTLVKGNIGGRNSVQMPNKALVVDGTISRPGATPGHVDGRLRLPMVIGSNSKLFTVGIADEYNPMEMTINGPGGAPGYLDAYVLVDTDAPNITRNTIESQLPNGPELDSTKNIRKVWVLHADTTGSQLFALAASRNYDLEFFFTASDTTDRGNPLAFEIGQRDTSVNAGHWSKPFVSDRKPLSAKFSGNQNFHNNSTNYFIIGSPKIFTYYSIADGEFHSASTWSTAGYESMEEALRPPNSNDNIRIGNGKTVTLNSNYSVGDDRLLVVETGGSEYENGHLVFGQDNILITGQGTFRLDSGAAVTIRHSQGISNNGNNGCVRVSNSNRQYNYQNHNRGHFIYA